MKTTQFPTIDLIEKAIGIEAEKWYHQCHATSLAIVRSGLVGQSRVARGTCDLAHGAGQHSWIVLGDDCYASRVDIIDPTLWSYQGAKVPYIWMGEGNPGHHVPHGTGDIWKWGHPDNCHKADAIKLTPTVPFSREAKSFIDILGPLDRRGWMTLSSAPVGGWPAGEIFGAMEDTEGLEHLVPIDKLGMTTHRNPSALYF